MVIKTPGPQSARRDVFTGLPSLSLEVVGLPPSAELQLDEWGWGT